MLLKVDAMTCGGCARTVTAILKDLDPDGEVQINVPDRTVELRTDKSPSEVRDAMQEGGYPAEVLN